MQLNFTTLAYHSLFKIMFSLPLLSEMLPLTIFPFTNMESAHFRPWFNCPRILTPRHSDTNGIYFSLHQHWIRGNILYHLFQFDLAFILTFSSYANPNKRFCLVQDILSSSIQQSTLITVWYDWKIFILALSNNQSLSHSLKM